MVRECNSDMPIGVQCQFFRLPFQPRASFLTSRTVSSLTGLPVPAFLTHRPSTSTASHSSKRPTTPRRSARTGHGPGYPNACRVRKLLRVLRTLSDDGIVPGPLSLAKKEADRLRYVHSVCTVLAPPTKVGHVKCRAHDMLYTLSRVVRASLLLRSRH